MLRRLKAAGALELERFIAPAGPSAVQLPSKHLQGAGRLEIGRWCMGVWVHANVKYSTHSGGRAGWQGVWRTSQHSSHRSNARQGALRTSRQRTFGGSSGSSRGPRCGLRLCAAGGTAAITSGLSCNRWKPLAAVPGAAPLLGHACASADGLTICFTAASAAAAVTSLACARLECAAAAAAVAAPAWPAVAPAAAGPAAAGANCCDCCPLVGRLGGGGRWAGQHSRSDSYGRRCSTSCRGNSNTRRSGGYPTTSRTGQTATVAPAAESAAAPLSSW